MHSMLRQSFRSFHRHRAQWLAAAIAYYMTFAVAPLIIVVVAIAGLVLGHHRAALEEIYAYIGSAAGPAAATAVQSIVHATFMQMQSGTLTKVIGWVVFLVATIGFFTVLQDALNIVWEVTPANLTLADFVRSRGLAVAAVVTISLLLTVSLTVNSALTIAGNAAAGISPSFPIVVKSLDFLVSFLVVAGLLSLIYKFLPAARVEWRDVWLGSVLTSLLFVIGQFLLGWYLGRAPVSSTFGAFASLVVFLLWTNYSAQIMLFGAEFTQVFAKAHGSRKRT
jgi:membrane protein